MISTLLGWDASRNIVKQLTHMVVPDELGRHGHVDFEAHEMAGGCMTDIIVFSAVAFDDLPALPHPLFPDGGGRRAYSMVTHKTYRNEGDKWVETPPRIVGAGSWPEWLSDPWAHSIELHPSPGKAKARITALIHKRSGHRRERAAIEATIDERIKETHEAHRKVHGAEADVSRVPVDLRDILGGPAAPLLLDADGKTRTGVVHKRLALPVVIPEDAAPI